MKKETRFVIKIDQFRLLVFPLLVIFGSFLIPVFKISNSIISPKLFVSKSIPLYVSDPTPTPYPQRQQTISYIETNYQWLLLRWSDSALVSNIYLTTDTSPTYQDIATQCGFELAEQWQNSLPCSERIIPFIVAVSIYATSNLMPIPSLKSLTCPSRRCWSALLIAQCGGRAVNYLGCLSAVMNQQKEST